MTSPGYIADEVITDEGRMPLMEHLRELRDRLIKSAIAIAVGAVLGFILYGRFFDFLIKPYEALCDAGQTNINSQCDLLLTDPLEGFSIRIKVSTYSGIAMAMPILLWQLWRFISPGLYAKERRYVAPFIASALSLFIMGAGIAYWTLPKALVFLVEIAGVENVEVAYSPAKYLQLVTYMMLIFGLGFQFPIILVFLQMVGLLNPESLAKYRRHSIVGITVLVAVITPSADPISMFALAIPMWIFYEASIRVGRVLVRRRRSAEAAS